MVLYKQTVLTVTVLAVSFVLNACDGKQTRQSTTVTQSAVQGTHNQENQTTPNNGTQTAAQNTQEEPQSTTVSGESQANDATEENIPESGTNHNGTTGSDNNPSTSSDNGSLGSEINSSAGGNNSNGTSSGSSDNHTSTGDGNSTVGGSGTDDNTTDGGTNSNTATLKSLNLTIAKTTLNKDHNTTLTLKAVYDDNTTKTPSSIEWLINPKDAVAIKGTTLTALKDTNVTLQAKVGNTLSNKVKLNIYWEVDGHRLPPEPDPKINNATLLGVDVNHNGVRDDVERWVYNKYKDKHPIHIDIAMQAARGYKLILEKQPKTREEAKRIHYKSTSYLDCQSYYKTYAKYFHEPILIKSDTIGEYFRGKVYFNTSKRKNVYEQYDILLSGDSYSLPEIEVLKSLCDFNTSKYDKE